MGWETRRGKRYYYRKERVDGRVRSIYCGSGINGEIAEMQDAQRQRSTTPERKAHQPPRKRGRPARPVHPSKFTIFDYMAKNPKIKICVRTNDAEAMRKAQVYFNSYPATLCQAQKAGVESMPLTQKIVRNLKDEHPYLYIPLVDDENAQA